MPRYRIFNRCLASTLELPKVPRAPGTGTPDITFTVRAPSADAKGPLPKECLRLEVEQREGRTLRLYRLGSTFVARWVDLHDFEFSPDGRRIVCYPRIGADESEIRACLCGTGMAFALHLQGVSTLHASAVALGTGAVAFLGTGGSGKSSLAGTFVREGYSILTDDVLAIADGDGGFQALPGFPWVTLTPESYSYVRNGRAFPQIKTRKVGMHLHGSSFCSNISPLRGLYVLHRHQGEEAREVAIAPVAPQEAAWELLQYTCCLPLLEQHRLAQHFRFLCRLVSSVPVWRLHYPSNLEHITGVIEAIVDREGG